MSSLSSLAQSPPQPPRPSPGPATFFARNPLAWVAVVIALAMAAAYVHVLNEAVVSAERTRESWRAAQVEKVLSRDMVRGMVRDRRVRPGVPP